MLSYGKIGYYPTRSHQILSSSQIRCKYVITNKATTENINLKTKQRTNNAFFFIHIHLPPSPHPNLKPHKTLPQTPHNNIPFNPIGHPFISCYRAWISGGIGAVISLTNPERQRQMQAVEVGGDDKEVIREYFNNNGFQRWRKILRMLILFRMI
ncbi:hypothetical protein LIER_02729 [Lithospermum erythrorhizon]|uniref:Uncharacterized protein n=1 Tax=Lithospermum erythrorhizon TaxID=34254 RepID=A0AAV3NQX7_LITER